MEKGSIRIPLLTNQITAAASVPQDVRSYQALTVYASGTGTITSGTLIVEEADWDPFDSAQVFSGTWSAIPGATILGTAVTAGAQQALHLPAPAAYAWLRVRLSVAVGGGGSMSVALRCG